MSKPIPVATPPRQYPPTLQSSPSLPLNPYESSHSPYEPYAPKIVTVPNSCPEMESKRVAENLEENLRMSNDALSNSVVLENLKCLDSQTMMKLEKLCIEKFSNYALFLLYEISCEFCLPGLHKLCDEEFVNENYEQLNYSKYDLVKCSKNTFCRLLDEYLEHLSGLEIFGIKVSELTNVINDYCVMGGIGEDEKNRLEKKYVKNGQVGIIGAEGETSKSMENVRRKSFEIGQGVRNKIILAHPPKLENSCDCDLTSSRELKENNRHVAPKALLVSEREEAEKFKNVSMCSIRLKESAHLIKEQIEKINEKENLLFSEIVSTLKEIENDENTKEIEEGFAKLEKSVRNIENEIKVQNERIEKLKKDAGIKLKEGGEKEQRREIF